MSSIRKSLRGRLAIAPSFVAVRPNILPCRRQKPVVAECRSSILFRCLPLPRPRLFSSRSNGVGSAEPAAALKIPVARAVSQEERTGDAILGLQETPSEALISALRERGSRVDIAEPKFHSVDLSWVDPNNVTDKEQHAELRAHQDKGSRKGPARLSYATIVANYIRYVDPILSTEISGLHDNTFNLQPLDISLLRVFDDITITYLSQRGYSVGDVMTWAWILLSADSFNAAMRLTTANSRIGKVATNRIPLFVLLFTLRRKHINSKTLQLLLTQSGDILLESQCQASLARAQSDKHTAKPSWMRSGDDTSIMILFVRLVRAARLSSPESLVPISHMFTKVFGSDALTSPPKDKQTRRLITYYNKFLTLLAVPCRVEPFVSTLIQQRCIFHLLREMTKFDPPLQVTREGYHAVTRIHAARRKLPPERQWAEFKAKSWPPWKEDKLGIDVDRGLEGSKSKTLGSITRMKEAGYSPTRWDKIATILAGWDTDGTPTIQTRTFLPKPNPYRMRDQHTTWLEAKPQANDKIADPLGSRHEDTYPDIWAARIRATRTMKEAWACFLSCQDQGIRITNDIYYELTEKVIYHDYLQDSSQLPSTGELPGDGKEVHPEPSSPRDVIYVQSEPPSLDVLLRDILSQKIRIRKRLLALLLTHSTSFQLGLECLTHSDLQRRQVEALTTIFDYTDQSRKLHLDSIPPKTFAAFVSFLGKFSGIRGTLHEDTTISLSQFFPIAVPASTTGKDLSSPGAKVTIDQSLAHAVSLVRMRMPEYLPAWKYLFASLVNARLPPGNPYISLSAQRVVAWREVREVALWMEHANLNLDANCFHSICEAFAKLLLVTKRDHRGAEQGMEFLRQIECTTTYSLPSWPSTLSEVISDGVGFLKRKFDEVILSTDGPIFPTSVEHMAFRPLNPSTLPTVSAMPNPSTLHAFIRVLGLAADLEGLLHLLEWMSRNASGLKRVSKEHLGGNRSMRRAVVAARVYLEKNSLQVDAGISPALDELEEELEDPDTASISIEESESFQPDRYIKEAHDIIENSELLSPWPTDEEVQEYVAEHKGGF